MKTLKSALIILITVYTMGIQAQDKKENHEAKCQMMVEKIQKTDANMDGKVFACPKCEVYQDEAEKCSKCGGELHEMTVDELHKAICAKDEAHHHKMEMKSAKDLDKNKDGKVFQCNMCANEISDAAGECPACGMKLTEVSVEKAQQNLSRSKEKIEMKKKEAK
ncbi:heavy metal-binding domain-containing protein [Melioribacter sp. OK-6-Me]|uniref:heavy metal-binding domain-containing protein n=1 Tax=unclassified Melioribacter TaxID=2627329 RepID=UPI003ED9F4BF